jgi:hypothetical protein
MVKKTLSRGMRRLAPVPVRPAIRSHPLRAALLGPATQAAAQAAPDGSSLRLFFTAFAGGLVFFGTYLA